MLQVKGSYQAHTYLEFADRDGFGCTLDRLDADKLVVTHVLIACQKKNRVRI